MQNTKKVLWVITKSLRFCFPYILVNILILTFSNFISLAINLMNKNLINSLTIHSTWDALKSIVIGLLIAYIVLYILQKTSTFLTTFGVNFYRLNVDQLFHKIFMWKSCNTPQEEFFHHDFMDKYAHVSNNTSKISSFISQIVSLVFGSIANIVMTISLFRIYEPWLILHAVIVALCSTALYSYITKVEYQLEKKLINEQRYHNYYKDILVGKPFAKELRLYQTQNCFYQKWEQIYLKLRDERLALSLKRTRLYNLSVFVKFLFRVIAIAFLVVGMRNNRYDVGTFVMLFGLVEVSSNQVTNLSEKIMNGAYKDAKFLCDYYDFVMPVSSRQIKMIRNENYEDFHLPFGPFQQLCVDHVSYTYPNGSKKAINDLSLTVRKGEIVCILGYNGSGKTTLSKLLCGSLLPQEGSVTLNGVPLSAGNRQDVFKYFGFAPQEYSKFSLSINEFVGLGSVTRMNDPAALEQAYGKAGVRTFIDKQKTGDKTILGKEYAPDGIDLSGGEWQQLVIASAYMGDPEVLIMDEPSASIDPIREMNMINDFRAALQGKTALLISHRIAFARLADRIIVLKEGEIAEEGTHEELLSLNGFYSTLYTEQKKLYEEVV